MLYIKYDDHKLNVLDAEKKVFVLARPVNLELEGNFCESPELDLLTIGKTRWINVCPINGNMMASGGFDQNIKIFDKRESKIVKTFDKIHKGDIFFY